MAATAISPHSGDLLRRSGSGNGSFSEREQRQAARTSPGPGRETRRRSRSGSRSNGNAYSQGHGSVHDDDNEEEEEDEEDEPSASNLTVFLALAKLSQHEATLREEGYEEVDDLADADDSDLLRAGFKKPEIRRLRRYLSEHE